MELYKSWQWENWTYYNTSGKQNGDFLQNSEKVFLIVCQSLQIIIPAKSHRHSSMALAISNGFK